MRKIWDIHGGIHPAENKHQSLHNPIENAGIPPQLILPLAQHIGAPASPIVNVGDRVLKGQMIAEAKGFVSAPVHAPTSGIIAAIESRVIPHPSGMSASCIVIDTDGKDEWIAHQGLEDYTQLSKIELVDRVRQAGIAGMGGAGFPAAVKLSTRDDKPIETLRGRGYRFSIPLKTINRKASPRLKKRLKARVLRSWYSRPNTHPAVKNS